MSDAHDIADLATAQALITTRRQAVARTRQENASLRAQLDALCRRLYGKSSERVSPDPLRLAFTQLANAPGPATDPVEMDSGERPGPEKRRRARRPTGRRPRPAHLPRRRVEIDVPEADKTCACGHAKSRSGETVAAKLAYVPARRHVIETARLKYACAHGHAGVVEAAAPPQAVEKSLAAEGLLAQVIGAKYVDHLPLDRQSRILLREGVDLSRATLCGWGADVATALAPIGVELRRQIVAAAYLHTDDTTITIREDGVGSRTGRLWTYLDRLGSQGVFGATETRARAGPEAMLADVTGDLQADAYTGYDALFATGRIREIGCWAHTRRGVVDAFETDVAPRCWWR